MIALGGVERVKEDVRDARGTRLLEAFAGDFAFALCGHCGRTGFATVCRAHAGDRHRRHDGGVQRGERVLLAPLAVRAARTARPTLYRTTSERSATRDSSRPCTSSRIGDVVVVRVRRGAVSPTTSPAADVGSGDGAHANPLSCNRARSTSTSSAHPAIGTGFPPDDETGGRVVVLSHRLWKDQLAATPSAVGGIDHDERQDRTRGSA